MILKVLVLIHICKKMLIIIFCHLWGETNQGRRAMHARSQVQMYAAKGTSHETMSHPIVFWYAKYNFFSFLITFWFQMKYFLFYSINVIISSNGRINQKMFSFKYIMFKSNKEKG